MDDKRAIALPGYLEAGTRSVIGQHTFEEAEIIKFGKKFDPQTFHTDPAAANASLLGGLCASGWHTISVWMKLQRQFVAEQSKQLKAAGMPFPEYGPSPGMKHLKWKRPVFAGDRITYADTSKSIRQSRSKPGWWVYMYVTEGENQSGIKVLEFESTVLIRLHDGI